VSTFRALVEAQASIQVKDRSTTTWFKKPSRRRDLDRHTHAIDARGRVLRDNVWGKQIEDAARRDFTVNALYYDPADQTVHDYHHGLTDIRTKLLRMIGDPPMRYREDPVRMLRAVRFAAKTGFAIEPKTAEPIKELAHLIHHVPAARVFDELLKLLFCGHAWVAIQQLQQLGFNRSMLTLLDIILDQSDHGAFIQLAFADTDTRVLAGKPVSPGFLFAALLWHAVHNAWQACMANNMLPIPALHEAIDAVLAKRMGQLGIQRRHISDMKQIWLLQPRFERRAGQAPLRLLEAPRFRAAYDFLLLRARAGEVSAELADWWTVFQKASAAERNTLLAAVTAAHTPTPESETGGKRRKRRRRVKVDKRDNPSEAGPIESS
jgi:poly(A) polymerase